MSVLLSPCHLSSIPLIVGFLTSHGEKKTSRAFLLSLVFAFGILITIAVIGAITASLGRIMGDVGLYGKWFVAIIFVVVGLYLMDLIRLPDTGVRLTVPGIRSMVLSALMLGLIFGVALGPCTFAYLAPILGVVYQLSTNNIPLAILLLLAFGVGHCTVIVVAGVLASRIQAYLNWSHNTTLIVWIKRATGFLVLLGGVYTVFAVS